MCRTILSFLITFDNILCWCVWPVQIAWRQCDLRKIRQSIVTRLRYVCILLVATLVCFAMLSAGTWLFINEHLCTKIGYRNCELMHGPAPVYRVFFALFLYFLTMSLLMIGVENTLTSRTTLHNHIWLTKICLITLLIVGFILLPRTVYNGEVWHFFGLNSAFLFIVLQFIILIDAIHVLNKRIVNWMDDNENSAKYCFFVLWLPTSFFYLASIYGTVMLYKLYSSRTECFTNLFFISFHIYMCAAATFISINPIVQEAKPKSGLLQSSVTTAYSTYILWLSMSNQPDDICNPTREYLYPIDPVRNQQIILSLVITFGILFIFSLRIVPSPQYGKSIRKHHSYCLDDIHDSGSENDEEHENFLKNLPRTPSIVENDEIAGIEYSYSFFHLTLSVGSLYLMMTMTNWYRPEEEENYTVKMIAGWGAVWIKLCSGIFCVFLYIWSLMAPVLFPNSYHKLVFYELMFSV